MSAEYTASNYLGIVLFCAVAFFALSLILWPMICRRAMKKYQSVSLFAALLVGMIASFIPFLWITLPIFMQTADLLIPQEYTLRKTAGIVESISPAKHAQPCMVDGKIYWLQSVSMDGQEFFVIGNGKLEEGMLVQLKYAAAENNVILSWQETTQQQAELVRQEQLTEDLQPSAPEPEKEIPQERKALGQLFGRLAIWGMAAFIALEKLFHQKIVNYLLEKDAEVSREITANLPGVFLTAFPFVFILFGGLSILFHGDNLPIFLFLLLAMTVILGLQLVNSFTHLKLDGQYITVRRLGRQYEYEISQLNGVLWQNCRGYVGQQLFIRFGYGQSYYFNMDLHRGVQNTYNELTARTKNMSPGSREME